MSDRAYMTKGLPPPPAVSQTTVPMAGLLVDVYGLDELRASASASAPVTALWLLHPRTRTRDRMADIARRVVHAWNASPGASSRGLVALAFDMPNHGSRLVHEPANAAWDEGNDTHALDMVGLIRAASADVSALMDLLPGYLGRDVDGHVCLGWSLGGHAAWQAWFGEERLDAAVVVVGCPDLMGLLSSRAQLSALDCGGSPFLGSRFFPPSLVSTCRRHDPKAVLFGTDAVPPSPLPAAEAARVRGVLDARRLRSKRLLLCSGGADELVPYAASVPLLAVLKDERAGVGAAIDDRVYEGVGHRFNKDMVEDAVRFLVEVVGQGPRERREEERARM